ncbi:MAG: hypothetical protein IPH62_19945 [Ignavibacteriae bacterium]|nr:hypothetical protein [Ignavibacteriota bacterium]
MTLMEEDTFKFTYKNILEIEVTYWNNFYSLYADIKTTDASLKIEFEKLNIKHYIIDNFPCFADRKIIQSTLISRYQKLFDLVVNNINNIKKIEKIFKPEHGNTFAFIPEHYKFLVKIFRRLNSINNNKIRKNNKLVELLDNYYFIGIYYIPEKDEFYFKKQSFNITNLYITTETKDMLFEIDYTSYNTFLQIYDGSIINIRNKIEKFIITNN